MSAQPVQAFVKGVLYSRTVNGKPDFLFYVMDDVPSGYEKFTAYPIAVHHTNLGTESFINVYFVQPKPKPDPSKVIEFQRASDSRIMDLMRSWRSKPQKTLEDWVIKTRGFEGLLDEEKDRVQRVYEEIPRQNEQ